MLVHTSETVRLRYFLDLLMANSRPVMLVGGAGCGKTVLVNDKLSTMREDYLITTIPFNHYTTSLMLQGVMEKPLEKKAGVNYRVKYFQIAQENSDLGMIPINVHPLVHALMSHIHMYTRNTMTFLCKCVSN